MPLLSLATFIETEEDMKAKLVSDLAKFNYDEKEKEDLIESIHI